MRDTYYTPLVTPAWHAWHLHRTGKARVWYDFTEKCIPCISPVHPLYLLVELTYLLRRRLQLKLPPLLLLLPRRPACLEYPHLRT